MLKPANRSAFGHFAEKSAIFVHISAHLPRSGPICSFKQVGPNQFAVQHRGRRAPSARGATRPPRADSGSDLLGGLLLTLGPTRFRPLGRTRFRPLGADSFPTP